MKIAIYGAGSLGIILGAYMTKGGIPVDLINRNLSQVDALKKNGAQVTGSIQFSVPVSALLPSEMKEKYEVIFLMTKQQDNEKVVNDLIPFLKEDECCVLCKMDYQKKESKKSLEKKEFLVVLSLGVRHSKDQESHGSLLILIPSPFLLAVLQEKR